MGRNKPNPGKAAVLMARERALGPTTLPGKARVLPRDPLFLWEASGEPGLFLRTD